MTRVLSAAVLIALIVATLCGWRRRGRPSRWPWWPPRSRPGNWPGSRARSARACRPCSGDRPRRRSLRRLHGDRSTSSPATICSAACCSRASSRPARWRSPPARRVRRRSTRAAVALMAPIYVGLPLGAIAWMRVTAGASAVFALAARIVAVSDSAQYYTGRAFGRREAGAGRQSGQDGRRRDRRARRRGDRRARSLGLLRAAGRRRRDRAPSLGAARSRCSACRRSVRVAAQAQRRREGQLRADSRPRRRARSHRQLPVRRAVLLPVPAVAGVKRIAILGSTGSIGRSALAVVDAHADRLQVVGAGGRRERRAARRAGRAVPAGDRGRRDRCGARGARAAARRRPSAVARRGGARRACSRRRRTRTSTSCSAPRRAPPALEAALAAIDAGKTLALANKEVLVMAGALMVDAARRRGVAILPVDSEHNAIHQCLHGRRRDEVRRLILTASGGPFRSLDAAALARVTPGGRAAASHLADGPEDHDRFGHADEQGPRGDRGALAVRRCRATRSTSSSIRSRSCTRWWSCATDRSSRSSA